MTRPFSNRPSKTSGLLSRLAMGAAAGFAGTVALQVLRTGSSRWLPQTMPAMHEEPGHFMVEQAEQLIPPVARERIPSAVESAAANSLAVGYGLTFGALYAALRPRGGDILADGAALGLATWAAGYLGWLPALGLAPPVWRQRAPQALAPPLRHVAYGMATVAAYNGLIHQTRGRA